MQITLLTKLGDKQLDNIRKLSGSNPCLVTSESRRKEKALIALSQAGEYTHILLRPKQALSKLFRRALKNPELQGKLGLVAIDERHLVKQWKDFCPAFTMLGQLCVLLC